MDFDESVFDLTSTSEMDNDMTNCMADKNAKNLDEPIDFKYEDTDSYENEIGEIYAYGEEHEFFANRSAFEECMEDKGLPLIWKHMVDEQKFKAINYLMMTLEVSNRSVRIKSCRALAYLVQGNFGECLSLAEQAENSKSNVFLLYEQGIFQSFVQQLLIECEITPEKQHNISKTYIDSTELRLILSVLCTITETMYHVKETDDTKRKSLRQQFILDLQQPYGDELLTIILFQMLNKFCGGNAPHYPVRKITLLLWKIILITLGGTNKLREIKTRRRKAAKLSEPLEDIRDVVKNMRPCTPPMMADNLSRPRAAIAGGLGANKRKVFKQPAFDDAVFAYARECLMNTIAEMNQGPGSDNDADNNDRNADNYSELNESIEAIRKSDDPAESKSDNETKDDDNIITSDEDQSDKENEVDKLDTADATDSDLSDKSSGTSPDSGVMHGDDSSTSKDSSASSLSDDTNTTADGTTSKARDDEMIDSLIVQVSASSLSDADSKGLASKKNFHDGAVETGSGIIHQAGYNYKGLPWSPKVRKHELTQHMSNLRQKFLGYTLPNDLTTTFGLPDPIIEGINVLKKHLYISLSEAQLDREELIERFPLTHRELDQDYNESPAEKLYQALLPRLPQYMIALLKILLAALPNMKMNMDLKNLMTERSDSINLMNEINPDFDESMSGLITRRIKVVRDFARHMEIIIKAVSATLLLLLKHFKTNHIYQFEYVSQQLMFANCIPLILKFLSHDIASYIVSTSRSNLSVVEFPACVIGEQPDASVWLWGNATAEPYNWRNMFSCINLVRILNKLTKWKHSRIMMLVVFKSAPTLARALSVRQALFQLYVLKLLKVQMKFLGRQWKKLNMNLISLIYLRVRHRLTDDWAYSNDNEAKPWDFQAEEFTLQANINKFHQRRYSHILSPATKTMGAIDKSRLRSNLVQADHFSSQDDYYEDNIDPYYEEGSASQLSSDFERNYESWLDSEVFRRRIDWDQLLVDCN